MTVRDLAARAGVNLAAIGYHFGGKHELYREAIVDRIRAVNERRLAGLERLAMGDRGATLRRVLEAFIGPLLDAYGDPGQGGPAIVRVLARTPVATRTVAGAMDDLQPVALSRFAQAIRRHVPQLPPEEYLWRFTFVVGAMHHALANLHQMSALTHGICRDDDRAGLRRRIVDFAAGVFAASAPPSRDLAAPA